MESDFFTHTKKFNYKRSVSTNPKTSKWSHFVENRWYKNYCSTSMILRQTLCGKSIIFKVLWQINDIVLQAFWGKAMVLIVLWQINDIVLQAFWGKATTLKMLWQSNDIVARILLQVDIKIIVWVPSFN